MRLFLFWAVKLDSSLLSRILHCCCLFSLSLAWCSRILKDDIINFTTHTNHTTTDYLPCCRRGRPSSWCMVTWVSMRRAWPGSPRRPSSPRTPPCSTSATSGTTFTTSSPTARMLDRMWETKLIYLWLIFFIYSLF